MVDLNSYRRINGTFVAVPKTSTNNPAKSDVLYQVFSNRLNCNGSSGNIYCAIQDRSHKTCSFLLGNAGVHAYNGNTQSKA